jgi:hypothetical protein
MSKWLLSPVKKPKTKEKLLSCIKNPRTKQKLPCSKGKHLIDLHLRDAQGPNNDVF